jgi:hypothetical protein
MRTDIGPDFDHRGAWLDQLVQHLPFQLAIFAVADQRQPDITVEPVGEEIAVPPGDEAVNLVERQDSCVGKGGQLEAS